MQIVDYNRSVDQSLDCLTNLNNQCVTGPPQMLMKKIFGNLKQSIKDRCTNDDNLKEFLDNLMCLDTADKVEQVRRCSDKHIRILQAVSDLATENRMSAMCCALQEHQDCMEKTIRDQCGSSQAEFFKTLIAEYADEMVMVQCDNFNSMEKCATNLPADQWNVLKPLIETAPGDPVFKSDFKTPVPIMVKMLGKFYKS